MDFFINSVKNAKIIIFSGL